jgi:ribosome-associated protein
MLFITPNLTLPESELHEDFVRAPGPGGQHVNKASTAVQLRFQAARSPSLPEAVRRRLLATAGARATSEGEIVIQASRFRSREQNRQDARRRLVELIRRAAARPRKRKPTQPTAASRRRRLNAKRQRAQLKKSRKRPIPEDA